MHRSLVGSTAILLATLLIAMVARSSAAEPGVEDARKVAEQWLALVDQGKYDDSWSESASYFRSKVTKADWRDAADAARAPLGALESRTFSTAQATQSLPGAPAGEYIVLVYDTKFAGGSAREIVTPMHEADGHWRVTGYFVQ